MVGLKLLVTKFNTYIYQVVYFTAIDINGFRTERIYERSSYTIIGSVLFKMLKSLYPLFIAVLPDEVKNTSGRIATFTS